MRFAEPVYFYLIVAALFLGGIILWSIARKKRLLSMFGDLPLIMKTAPYVSFARQRTRGLILTAGLILLVVTLARLQFGTHMEMMKREGLDIFVALDVSNSMLAQDIKPTRLAKAKQQLRGIIDRLAGDRIGLVAFAGEAFVQCPLTMDYAACKMLLEAMDVHSVNVQGTSLTAALETAAKSYQQLERKHKVLILLTDGENQQGDPVAAATEARREGIRVYTVGIGSPEGEPIPVLDRNGNQVGFRKDQNGEVIVTTLDEGTLQKIALETGGKYFRATPGELELDKIFDEISSMEKKDLEGTLVTRYDDRYQWPLALAIFLILLEFFLPERKKPSAEVQHG